MIRAGALLLALAAVAAADTVVLVDGEILEDVALLGGDAATIRLRDGDTERVVPARNVVSIRFAAKATESVDPFNLYLRNGDRLRGVVAGDGDHVLVAGVAVLGLKVPLERVRAVRFGRLMAGVKAKYNEAFERELKRGRDVVIVQRNTRPFPVYATVLGVGRKTLTVRVGDRRRELEQHKIYGFVRAPGDAPDEPQGTHVRAFLTGGGRITLPLQEITATQLVSELGRLDRAALLGLEFVGDHMRHLSSFDPVDVKQVALFGEAPPWRRDGMVLGGPLRLDGRTYARGIGVQAYSRLEFVLGGRWNALFLRCGVDDASGREGAATFRILGDGRLLAEVAHRHGAPSAKVRLDIKGIDRLVLEAVPGESYVSDFCDWVEARVFNAAAVHDPPRDGE